MTTATQAKSHPILFKGEMVTAILNGTKTQTRRIVKPQPVQQKDGTWELKQTSAPNVRSFMNSPMVLSEAPARKGDHLWVRETLYRDKTERSWWRYKADDALVLVDDEQVNLFRDWSFYKKGNTCVSIHAPRWSSRITLEILDVRLQTLQSISEEDAIAEGISRDNCPHDYFGDDRHNIYCPQSKRWVGAPDAFQLLWESIHGAESWGSNPWVWIYKFRKIGEQYVN